MTVDANPTTRSESNEGLYAAVARGPIDDLPEIIRHFHFGNADIHAAGLLEVRHGSRRLARALARLMRLPREGEHVAAGLSVLRDGRCEVWKRSFDDRTVKSCQYRSSSLLAERVGPLELLFRVDVRDGALVFATNRARLRFFKLTIGLPRLVAPVVAARITSPPGGEMRVAVTISTPLTCDLLTYRGTIREVTQ